MRGLQRGRRVAAVAVLAVVAGCGSGSDDDAIDVFAAASLTDAFEEIAEAFEAGHPGVDVRLNLAGSSTLREQIAGGAPADVYASANPDNMAHLVAAGLVEAPTTFATNRLRIAVPAGNPAGIGALADLADPDHLVGRCAAEVPCGELARRVAAAADVEVSIDTEEPDVRALLLKVAEGELDAGLVYATDVAAAADVEGVDVPSDVDIVAEYPIGTVADGPDEADEFVDFVLGEEGEAILAAYGFGLP